MPFLVATPAAACRGLTACRLTVWCHLLIHDPTETRAWWGGGKGSRGTAWVPDNAGQRPRGLREDRAAALVNGLNYMGVTGS